MKHLIDSTIKFHPDLGWISQAPDKADWFIQRDYQDLVGNIIKDMDSDYKRFHYQPMPYQERLHNRVWKAKFNKNTKNIAILTGDYLTPLMTQLIPSALMAGQHIILCHLSGRTHILKARQNLSTQDAYRLLNSAQDWLAEHITDLDNLTEKSYYMEVLACQVCEMGFIPTPDTISLAEYMLTVPEDDEMYYQLENLGPLYDLELPHPNFIRSYESSIKVNSKGDRHLRPDISVRYPKTTWLKVADYDRLELLRQWLQLQWYLSHGIEPIYQWTDIEVPITRPETDDEDALPAGWRTQYSTQTVRYTHRELADLQLAGRYERY